MIRRGSKIMTDSGEMVSVRSFALLPTRPWGSGKYDRLPGSAPRVAREPPDRRPFRLFGRLKTQTFWGFAFLIVRVIHVVPHTGALKQDQRGTPHSSHTFAFDILDVPNLNRIGIKFHVLGKSALHIGTDSGFSSIPSTHLQHVRAQISKA